MEQVTVVWYRGKEGEARSDAWSSNFRLTKDCYRILATSGGRVVFTAAKRIKLHGRRMSPYRPPDERELLVVEVKLDDRGKPVVKDGLIEITAWNFEYEFWRLTDKLARNTTEGSL